MFVEKIKKKTKLIHGSLIASLSVCGTNVDIMWFKATLLCYAAITHAYIPLDPNLTLKLSRERVILLATQILYLHIGKQPRPYSQPSVVCQQAKIKWQATPKELDLLIDARNTIAHPCCPKALRSESIELLRFLRPIKKNLSNQELLAMQILGIYVQS